MAGLRPSSDAPVPPPKDNQHSTLEVDLNRWLENDGKSAPIVGHDPRDEKAVSHNDEKITSYSDVGKQAVVINVPEVKSESSRIAKEPKAFGLHRKKFLILWPLILVLIIAGTVGGGVGGSMNARKKEKIATIPTSTPAPIS